MLRAVWFGIAFAVAPMAACSKDSATPATAAHVAAGKVVAISGKVEAIRNGEPRTLAMADEIFADDEVVVGADGSVGIDLAHNNARWSLEAGRRGKVRDSLAWTMAKVDTPANPVEHATSAAGREGERNAATTATTESEPTADEPVGGAPGAPAPPITAVQPPAKPLPKPDPKPAPKGTGELGTLGHGAGGGTGQGYGAGKIRAERTTRAPASPPPPPPPPTLTDKDMDDQAPPLKDPEDAKRQDAIRNVIHAQKAALQQCPGAAGLKVNITVARSAAKVMIVGGKTADPDATQKCMETKLQRLKLARAEPFSVILDL